MSADEHALTITAEALLDRPCVVGRCACGKWMRRAWEHTVQATDIVLDAYNLHRLRAMVGYPEPTGRDASHLT